MVTCQSRYFEERLTGTGENVTVKTSVVWVATANNAHLTEDAGSRSLVIQLDPNLENPDQREFKSDAKAFICENRSQVCGAIITLVRAWLEKGRPSYSGSKRFRFPQWLAVMGGILQTVGIEGLLENLEEQRAHIGANAGQEWHELTSLWWQAHGEAPRSCDQLLPLVEQVSDVAAQLGEGDQATRRRKFAQFLCKRRDCIFGHLKIKTGPVIERKPTLQVKPALAATALAV